MAGLSSRNSANLGLFEESKQAVDRLTAEKSRLTSIVELNDLMSSMALSGASPASLVSQLSNRIAQPIVLLDRRLSPVAMPVDAAWERMLPVIHRNLGIVLESRQVVRLRAIDAAEKETSCVVAPVIGGSDVVAFLVLLPGGSAAGLLRSEDSELAILQFAAVICSVAMTRVSFGQQVLVDSYRSTVRGLLSGDQTTAAFERLALDPMRPITVMAVVPGKAAGGVGRVVESAQSILLELCPDARPVIEVNHEVEHLVVLFNADDQAMQNLANSVCNRLNDWMESKSAVAIGLSTGAAREIRTTYRQALDAAQAAKRFGGNANHLSYGRLGLLGLLAKIEVGAELESFVESTLGPLITYDRNRGTELVATVRAFLECNQTYPALANLLKIHPNTAAYRIQRIREISGLDLLKGDDALLGQVAVLIHEDLSR